MVIEKISVQNFRSHNSFTATLSPNITLIIGKNGSGKTSLIEAIYLALKGSSFRGSDSDILHFNTPWWRVDIELDGHEKRSITFNPELNSCRKKFIIDEKNMYRLSPKYKYPVVLFEPEDLRLLHGSPSRRRQFIDRFISQLDAHYQTALQKYERALRQRNSLLKNRNFRFDQLFVWNVTLSEYGAYIIEKRIAFIERINSKLNDAYNKIAKSEDVISIHYSHTHIGDIKQKLLNDLHGHIERDKVMGFTSTGPHRHDVIFQYNGVSALEVASRGEVRSIVLALKFIEVEIIEQIVNEKPIILLDDVFSELDGLRQKQLLISNNQTVIATTDNRVMKFINGYNKIINL